MSSEYNGLPERGDIEWLHAIVHIGSTDILLSHGRAHRFLNHFEQLSELRVLVEAMREDARGLVVGGKLLPTDLSVTRLNEWAEKLEVVVEKLNYS